jgi:hypothetical protein
LGSQVSSCRCLFAGIVLLALSCFVNNIDAAVDELGLGSAKPKRIPMISQVYADPEGPQVIDPAAVTEYRSVLSALNDIACLTRPDISFAVSYLSRFLQAPTADKVARLREVVLYLKGTTSFGLHLGGSDCVLGGFCDADFAQCRVTRSSTFGILIQCGLGSLV